MPAINYIPDIAKEVLKFPVNKLRKGLYWTADSRSLGSPRLTPDSLVLADFIRDQQEAPRRDELELRELSLIFS